MMASGAGCGYERITAVEAPSGTVTFLFTDIEGSTRLWEVEPTAMSAALARHDDILRSAIEAHGGYVFSTGGDGFAVAFSRVGDAVSAALDAQRSLGAESWPTPLPLRVRMGLHTGEVEERDGDYFGPAVNRAARIMAAGHGGQVLVSVATAALAGAIGLVDLGEHAFAGLTGLERVFQLGAADFPPLRSVGSVPSNLPVDLSAFVGRERELAAVAGLLRSPRVVTLTGVGGVGKTRLAMEVAAGMVDEFPDGAWFVELAPLIDPALVASSVASCIGVTAAPGADPTEVVARFLAPRRALVVLDNCEHVIDAAAVLAERLVRGAPRARVLATSREPLNVKGEVAWRVPSLTVLEDGVPGDAVELFLKRAAEGRPGSGIGAADRDAVVQVCRRLDGIPLAIELAAARARTMSVEQIRLRLDDRFRLLIRGGRGAVPRQQTLEGAIDWSYELLTPAEQGLFDVSAVFAGDFDVAAVAAVAAVDEFEALDLLGQLVDKSMVEADPARDRYRLLETLRQYAWGRLVATERLVSARGGHATYYGSLAGEQARLMVVPGHQVKALDRLELDYDNLRAALAYLIENRQAEGAVRMVRRLVGLFNIRHPREGHQWFQQVVAIADGLPAKARSRLLGDAALAALNAGDRQQEAQLAEAAVETGGEDAPAIAHWIVAVAQVHRGDPGAVEQARRAVAIAAASNDLTTQVAATGTLAQALAFAGDEPGARGQITEAIAIAERLGNPTMTAAAYTVSGEALAYLGYSREAVAVFARGLAGAEASGPQITSHLRIAYVLESDDVGEAVRLLMLDLPVVREQLSGVNLLSSLFAAAKTLTQAGEPVLGATLLGTVHHHIGNSSRPLLFGTPLDARWYDSLTKQLRTAMGDGPLDQEFQRGAALTPEQALQLAYDAVSHLAATR
jgi:predicted ATPase/class 3 adenylate cyclase